MTGHMPGHVRSLESRASNQSWDCGSGHVLPSRVAPSQVHKSGDSLGNWSGDEMREIVVRWKNGVWMLHLGTFDRSSTGDSNERLMGFVLSPALTKSHC